jgi:hypothetical protein
VDLPVDDVPTFSFASRSLWNNSSIRTISCVSAIAIVFWRLTCAVGSAQAQSAQSSEARLTLSEGLPATGEMLSRDADGQLVIRAHQLPERVAIDGHLDEPFYRHFQPASGFIQVEPRYNEPATEQTQLWIFFDAHAIYIGLRCFDSAPERWSSLDMRRDSSGFGQGESVSVALDTFHDRRNGFAFGINPAGGISDGAITNERDNNRDWNTIWDSRVARFEGGWAVEMAIPFSSLRYAPGEQVWGINVRRTVQWKNEMSYLNPVPLVGDSPPQFGLFRFSSAATLVGLMTPPESKLFELKPYAISALKTDREADVPYDNRGSANIGFDAKIGVTRGLTADFTFNTDFAQVEDDEQQVNLTRFSLFYPEKREFFLEGQGIFAFGGASSRGQGRGGDVPLPFFSRRIGLDDDGRAVPILGGARMTGRAGGYTLGAVAIQTREEDASGQPSTNFSVFRARRDILRRSNVGVIVVNRSAYGTRLSANQTYGVDGVFSFFENVNINTYVAKTQTPGLRGDTESHRVELEYAGDRYGLRLEEMRIGRNFKPEAGYVQRADVRRNEGQLRFSPRPRSSAVVRQYEYSFGIDQFTRLSDGLLETRMAQATFGIQFHSSDQFRLDVSDNLEELTEPYEVVDGVEIPLGRFRFWNLEAQYEFGSQRRMSGQLDYEGGGFFGGTKHTIGFSDGRIEPVANLFIEPTVSINWIDIPQGTFTAKVAGGRFIYMFSPRTFISALVQYNSDGGLLATNARFRWEYRPGSDLFIVYSDGRNTIGRGRPTLRNRAVTVKLTRFFRV